MSRTILLEAAAIVVFCFAGVLAQNPPAAPSARLLSPTARLVAAQTVYLKNAGGSDLPFNVISEALHGWGRYRIVDSATSADLIVEVTSPSAGSGVSVTSTSDTTDPRSGYPKQAVTTTRELNVSRITLIVYDSKSKAALWSASEQPKTAIREKNRRDNVVDSAQQLARKFRERVEPDSK